MQQTLSDNPNVAPEKLWESANLMRLKRSEVVELSKKLQSQSDLNRLDAAITKRLREIRYESADLKEGMFFFGLNMRRLYENRANKQSRLYLQDLKNVEPSLLFFFHAGFLQKEYEQVCKAWAEHKKAQLENFQRQSAETPLSPDFVDQVEVALAAPDLR